MLHKLFRGLMQNSFGKILIGTASPLHPHILCESGKTGVKGCTCHFIWTNLTLNACPESSYMNPMSVFLNLPGVPVSIAENVAKLNYL